MYFGNQPYSFGLTLKELSAQTCDENWIYKFFDRTLDENKDKALFKLLEMNKFAVYWQSNETSLALKDCKDDIEMHMFMEELFPKENSHIEGYNYVIEPSKFSLKFKTPNF